MVNSPSGFAQDLWSGSGTLLYYSQRRRTLQDLYPSERRLLEAVVPRVGSVLDFGCAAGGFANVFSSLRPGIRYTGVDSCPEMIERARQMNPGGEFLLQSSGRLDFSNGSFEMAFCTGVLHHNPDYPALVRELYRVCSRFCVLDLPRMTLGPYRFDPGGSHMSMSEPFGTEAVVPYVLANPEPLFDLLLSGLAPLPAAVAAVGYFGDPGPGVTVPVRPVCFCVVCLVKNPTAGSGGPALWLDLPQEILRQLPIPLAGPKPAEPVSLNDWIAQVAAR